MTPSGRSESSTISAVSRTLAVLHELSDASAGLTAGELSARTGVSLSMVSRILTTLLQDGYLVYDTRTGLFSLALKTLAMCYRYADRLGFPAIMMASLQRLADETGEVAQLAVVQGDEMWFVAKAEGRQRVKLVSLVGQKVVLHAMAAGRAWLAHLPEATAFRLVMREGLKAFTRETITTIEELRAELARTRERGYALNVREMFEEVVAIACPVVHPLDGVTVVGALVLTGPAFRVSEKALRRWAPAVNAEAAELTKIWPTNVSLWLGDVGSEAPGPKPKRKSVVRRS